LKKQFDALLPLAKYERVLGATGEPEHLGFVHFGDAPGAYHLYSPMPANHWEPNAEFRVARDIADLALAMKCKWARRAAAALDPKLPNPKKFLGGR
jgi:hypothetical protein